MSRRVCEYTALVLLGFLVALLLVEAGLQVAALRVWGRAEQRQAEKAQAAGGGNERVILCLGDSFTYGMGASSADKAYPSRLEQVLNEAGDLGGASEVSWRVVNRGWPGRNSSEVLQRTPGFLLREKPDYVYVLIGSNNRWSRREMDLAPPRLEGASSRGEDRRWRWELRTLRLLRIAWVAFTPQHEPPEDEEPDGSERPRQNSTDQDVRPRSEPTQTRTPAQRPGAGSAKLDRPRKTNDEKPHLLTALKEIERLIKNDQDVIDLAAVSQDLDRLRLEVRGVNDQAAAELLLRILSRLYRFEAVIEEGLFSIEKYGKTPEFCGKLVLPLARLGRLEEALAWADEALRLQQPGGELGWLYRSRAIVHRRMGNLPEYVRDTILEFSIERDDELLAHHFRKLVTRRPSVLKRESEYETIMAQLSLSPELQERVRESLRRVLAEAQPGETGEPAWQQKLKDDLRHIVVLVQEFGARPILLTYPNPSDGRVSDALRQVADESRVPLIDLASAFEAILHSERKEDYFIADGHCNDQGYRIMAEQATTALRSLSKLPGTGVRAN